MTENLRWNPSIVCALAACFASCAHSPSDKANARRIIKPSRPPSVEYDSRQLVMKNAEEVAELVRAKIQKAESIQSQQIEESPMTTEPEAVEALKDGLRIILSRPDQDGARNQIFSRLRRELSDLNAFDETIRALAHESIWALNDKKTSIRHQATYIVLLENLMSELKAEMTTHEPFRQIIADVRDAQIRVSDQLINHSLMRSMSQPVSPSKTAAKILPKM